MRRLCSIWLFLFLCLIGNEVKAERVTVYFYPPSEGDWSEVHAYSWREDGKGNAIEEPLGNWTGKRCSPMTDISGKTVWKMEVTTEESLDEETYYIIFNNNKDGDAKRQTVNLKLYRNGVYKADGTLGDVTDVLGQNFEFVAKVGGTTVVLPLSPSRMRDGGDYSTLLYTVGFKDDMLPGKKGDKVACFLREQHTNVEYRPLEEAENGSFGANRVHTLDAVNCNVTYYGNAAYTTATTDRMFTIIKGQGVSYTLALNLGAAIVEGQEGANSVTYPALANSVSLYVNRSVIAAYQDTYASYKVGKNKDEVEDFYLIGQLSGKDNSYSTVCNEDNLMKKQVYLNPITQEVDSVVYSLMVRKPVEVDFKNLFLAFMPKSLVEDNDKSFGVADWTGETIWEGGSPYNKWNFIIRPQVQDGYDGTATSGCVLIPGSWRQSDTDYGYESGNQALNPLVGNSYETYVVRLNTTTSTYRLEFLNSPVVDLSLVAGTTYIRTYSSQTDLSLPEDGSLRAYVVHDFKPAEQVEYTGSSQGTLYLRRLAYIPAGEGVVLVSTQSDISESKISKQLNVKFDASDTPEDWWANATYKENGERYRNYLVASLFGVMVENGTYDDENHYYTSRNFFLNEYFNTRYYKELKKENPTEASRHANYIGFFRSSGKVGQNKAYLQLPKEKMDFNGQITGSEKDDDSNALSKVALSFDDGIWDHTVTSIANPCAQHRDTTTCYTLQGTRVMHPQVGGVYICRGKVLVWK